MIILTSIGIHVYYTIIHNTSKIYAAEVSANQIKSTHCTVLSGWHTRHTEYELHVQPPTKHKTEREHRTV